MRKCEMRRGAPEKMRKIRWASASGQTVGQLVIHMHRPASDSIYCTVCTTVGSTVRTSTGLVQSSLLVLKSTENDCSRYCSGKRERTRSVSRFVRHWRDQINSGLNQNQGGKIGAREKKKRKKRETCIFCRILSPTTKHSQ